MHMVTLWWFRTLAYYFSILQWHWHIWHGLGLWHDLLWPLGQKSLKSYSVSGLVMEIQYEANGSSKESLLFMLSGLYVSQCGCNYSLTYSFCSCDDVLKDHLPFCAQVLLSKWCFLLLIKIHILLKTQTTYKKEKIMLQEKTS